MRVHDNLGNIKAAQRDSFLGAPTARVLCSALEAHEVVICAEAGK
jgi:hypothetical protein